MKQKHWFIQIMIFISLVLMLINAKLSLDCYEEQTKANRAFRLATQDSDDFMAASDYLTEQCRLYVVTGNYENVENYFKEINMGRRREIAVQMLYTNGGRGTKEYEYLEQSYALSNELMEKEIHAMRLIAHMNGISEDDMPAQLKEYKLYPAEKDYNRRILKEMANRLVFGEDYISKKAEIITKVDACSHLINTQSIEQQNITSEKMRKHLEIIFILIVVICALELISMVFFSPIGQKGEKKTRGKNGGFSMIELIIVLSIIAALSAIMVPALYRYTLRSKDAKAEQNAMEFKRVTELVLVDALMGELGDGDISPMELKYQALSTEAPAPEEKPDTVIIKTIYNSINLGGEKYNVIALINDYKVTQVTYRDLKTSKVYVWFENDPSGLVLQSEEYRSHRDEWLIFESNDNTSWILDYSSLYGEQIAWNGYTE